MGTKPDLKQLDMHIIQFLNNEPGGRNVRSNLAHELIGKIKDDVPNPETNPEEYKDEVEVFARRVSHRIDRGLLTRDLVEHVGPAPKSGLYELTDDGRQAAQIIDQWDVSNNRDRLHIGYDVDQVIGFGDAN